MAGLLKQLFGSDRPYVPSKRLPTDGWCQATGIGRMNVVWPWYEVQDPQPLVDNYGREVGVAPKLELHAPRSDRDVVLIVWSDSGGGFVVGSDWATSMSKMYPGARIELNSPLALNGALGRVARFNDQRETTWRVLIPRETSSIHMEVGVPSVHADAYWAQIETMLATWGWDD